METIKINTAGYMYLREEWDYMVNSEYIQKMLNAGMLYGEFNVSLSRTRSGYASVDPFNVAFRINKLYTTDDPDHMLEMEIEWLEVDKPYCPAAFEIHQSAPDQLVWLPRVLCNYVNGKPQRAVLVTVDVYEKTAR